MGHDAESAMVIHKYSREILCLAYYLATSRKKLVGKELEAYLCTKLEGRIGREHTVSSRTIHRWIDFAKKHDKNENTFDYYPNIHLPSFGLEKYEVMFREPRDLKFLDVIPHIYWISIVRDRQFEEYVIAHYLIPPSEAGAFRSVLDDIKKRGMVKGLEVHQLKTAIFIPSPFHEIIREDGSLKIDGNIDNSPIMNQYRVRDEEVQIMDEVRINPILIPLIFGSDKESLPYDEIWNEISAKLGDRLPDYFRGRMNDLPNDPMSGARFVQRSFKEINESFDMIYDHMRVYYKPFYEIPNVQLLNLILKLEQGGPINAMEAITRISERCIFLTSYLSNDPDGKLQARMNLMTSFDQLFIICKWLKQNMIEFDYFFVDSQKSWALWDRNYSKFAYWDLFDPRSMSWRFDTDSYLEKLSKIESP